ncbi:MAG: hypothetical protein ACOX8F_00735 [Sakamotonia sp.]|jgi:hypothetical protein
MKKLIFSLRAAFSGLAAAAVLLAFLTALDNLERDQSGEGRRRLEESIRRSCAACYAAEGIYPPDLSYLTSHYGIQIDERRYAVDYRAIAENLMPDITVLEKEP